MKQIRARLTYANVMSSLAVFLIIGGATAFAALARNSVGTKQLKNNAVSTAKLKANAVSTAKLKKSAVTNAKIKNGAVSGAKIAANTVTGGNINLESTPFSRVVAKLRGSSTLGVTGAVQNYPLSPSGYTQGAEEDDTYLGAMNVTFEAGCEAPRKATALVLLDSSKPTEPEAEEESIVALGVANDKAGGTVTKRLQLGPFLFLGSRFEPGTATSHTVNLVVEGECKSGTGIKATSGAVDVIGTR